MDLILALLKEREIKSFDLSMVAFGASEKVPSFWMCVHDLLPGGSQNQAVAQEKDS